MGQRQQVNGGSSFALLSVPSRYGADLRRPDKVAGRVVGEHRGLI